MNDPRRRLKAMGAIHCADASPFEPKTPFENSTLFRGFGKGVIKNSVIPKENHDWQCIAYQIWSRLLGEYERCTNLPLRSPELQFSTRSPRDDGLANSTIITKEIEGISGISLAQSAERVQIRYTNSVNGGTHLVGRLGYLLGTSYAIRRNERILHGDYYLKNMVVDPFEPSLYICDGGGLTHGYPDQVDEEEHDFLEDLKEHFSARHYRAILTSYTSGTNAVPKHRFVEDIISQLSRSYRLDIDIHTGTLTPREGSLAPLI